MHLPATLEEAAVDAEAVGARGGGVVGAEGGGRRCWRKSSRSPSLEGEDLDIIFFLCLDAIVGAEATRH